MKKLILVYVDDETDVSRCVVVDVTPQDLAIPEADFIERLIRPAVNNLLEGARP